MRRALGRVEMGMRTLSAALVGFAFGLTGCSGDPSHGAEPAPEDTVVTLEEGRLTVALTSLDATTGQLLYTLKNTSDRSVRFLQRDTALKLVSSNMFDVRRDGEPVDFVGTHIYWGEPRPQDFLDLPPGGIVEGLVDLPALYDMRHAGEYTVQARRRSVAIQGALAKDTRVVLAASASTSVWLDEEHRRKPTVDKFRNYAEDCTATELQDLSAGEEVAIDLAYAAVGHLNNIPFVGDIAGRYQRWFGDPERDWNDVRRAESVLARTVNPVGGLPQIQFSCRDEGEVIYVDSAGDGHGCGASVDVPVNATTGGARGTSVHVCPSFLGMDPRTMASVMIHEASHHQGTDDFVTNATDARNLAATDPDSAVESAENYERYVLEF